MRGWDRQALSFAERGFDAGSPRGAARSCMSSPQDAVSYSCPCAAPCSRGRLLQPKIPRVETSSQSVWWLRNISVRWSPASDCLQVRSFMSAVSPSQGAAPQQTIDSRGCPILYKDSAAVHIRLPSKGMSPRFQNLLIIRASPVSDVIPKSPAKDIMLPPRGPPPGPTASRTTSRVWGGGYAGRWGWEKQSPAH
jgi:hypothetical protein